MSAAPDRKAMLHRVERAECLVQCVLLACESSELHPYIRDTFRTVLDDAVCELDQLAETLRADRLP